MAKPHAEEHGERAPDDAPDNGFAKFDNMRAAMKDAEVKSHENEDADDETDPGEDGNGSGHTQKSQISESKLQVSSRFKALRSSDWVRAGLERAARAAEEAEAEEEADEGAEG